MPKYEFTIDVPEVNRYFVAIESATFDGALERALLEELGR